MWVYCPKLDIALLLDQSESMESDQGKGIYEAFKDWMKRFYVEDRKEKRFAIYGCDTQVVRLHLKDSKTANDVASKIDEYNLWVVTVVIVSIQR